MSSRNKAVRKKTVLLVDDDPDFVEQMRVQLQSLDFHVLPAASRAEAERILAEARPDLAVLDLMMEKMDDGFVLSREIKKQAPAIPVIFVTGVTVETGLRFDGSSEEEREWMQADALLDKPVSFEQIKQAIDKVMKG